MKSRKLEGPILFLLGALCFFVSQILLRLPIIESLNKSIIFNNLYYKYGLIIGILLVFSAGLFEEGFRFLFRNILLKDRSKAEKGIIPFTNNLKSALLFGLGHGLCEVAWLLSETGFSLSLINYLLIGLERILALIFHISMTIVIFRGFNKNRKYLYTFIAMGLHTLFNMPILFKDNVGINLLFVHMVLVDVFLLLWLFNIKNRFKEEDDFEEN